LAADNAVAKYARRIRRMMPTQSPAPVLLVVDDDEEVRSMVVEVLESHGFELLQADGGEQALEILRRDPRIRLLFTDVLMPGISGTVLAQMAMKLRPDLRVVLTSGYTRNEPRSGLPLVPKPYRIRDLIDTVEAALRV
jgi:CheY-like chemotaxis protein